MMIMKMMILVHDCDAVFRYHLACVVDDVSVSLSRHLPNRTSFQPSFRCLHYATFPTAHFFNPHFVLFLAVLDAHLARHSRRRVAVLCSQARDHLQGHESTAAGIRSLASAPQPRRI